MPNPVQMQTQTPYEQVLDGTDTGNQIEFSLAGGGAATMHTGTLYNQAINGTNVGTITFGLSGGGPTGQAMMTLTEYTVVVTGDLMKFKEYA